MPKKRNLPASSYPKEFMEIFTHVLRSGEAVRIATLGPSRNPYISLRADMHNWRKQLFDEGSPLAKELYGAMVVVGQDLDTSNWYLEVKPKFGVLGDALKGLAPSIEPPAGPTPAASGEAPTHQPLPPLGSVEGGSLKMSDIFGKKEK